MAKYETTQGDWKRVMGDLPGPLTTELPEGDDFPAGNVNFDGVGYEKLAAEAPETLAALRQAVAAGQIEIVGASYGQPYGLFHGGESNVRQRVYGARVVFLFTGRFGVSAWW